MLSSPMPTVKCLATLRRLRTLPARVLGDVQQPGGGRRLRLVLGAALGGYAQPPSLEADDGDRRARDLAGRRQGQRADPAHAWRSLAAKSTCAVSRGPASRDVILRSQSAISAGFAVPS